MDFVKDMTWRYIAAVQLDIEGMLVQLEEPNLAHERS